MHYRIIIFKLGVCLVFLCVAMGCSPLTINTNMLQPGRSDQAAQFKKVAVLPFDGPGGKEFASEIEAKLASIIINDKTYFEVVDRATMDRMLNEMKLSMSGIVDPATAAKVGKMVGAKAIYTGTITAASVNDSRYDGKRTRCAYQVTRTDNKGRSYQECGKYEDYTVSCTKRQAKFAFIPKLVEVETGKIIYSNTLERDAGVSVCADSQEPLPNTIVVMRTAQDAVKEEFRKDVAPHFVAVTITLMESTSDIDAVEAVSKVKAGLEFAKNNRMDRGCELWGEAKNSAPRSVTVLYNLGVCAELAGRLDEALDLYKQSDRLLSKPDEKITTALARVSESTKKNKRLGQQVSQ